VSLDDLLQKSGATMRPLDGTKVPARFSSLSAEVRAVRESAGLSALLHLTCLRISGPDAHHALDPLCPIELSFQSGTLRHTLLLGEEGRPLADLYLCNDEGAFLLLAEGPPKGSLAGFLGAHFPAGCRADIEDLSVDHVMLSLNGPFAWEVVEELEGQRMPGFGELHFYRPTERRTYFFTSRTAEFSYDLLVPRAEAERYWARILEVGAPFDVIPVGLDALDHAGLEDWSFNIHREGQADLTPLELQLQWRLRFSKDFLGKAALLRRKAAGITHRITALQSAEPIASGDTVRLGDRPIGTVLRAEPSITIGDFIGIGLLEQAYAHSGIDAYTVENAGAERPVRTVSAPFINNRSRFIPELGSYHDRLTASDFPDPVRNPAQAR
jgi:glycine cleavage system aminomethyltransferase T